MTGKIFIDRKIPRSRTPLRTLGFGLAAIAAVTVQSPASAEDVMPKDTRPMTGAEVYMIFRGKSWKWANGAGRMQDEGRRFTAWTQSDTDASWAEGRWILTDSGQLCLKADWHSQTATSRDKTCFSHRILGSTIYQKREPAGEWYVFKHSKPAQSDEFNKLVKEDLVEAKLPIIQNFIASQPVQPEQSQPKARTVRPEHRHEQTGEAQ
ncbi:DUF995 domain-containing protein [Sinorhizobium numidicum]|uniref:DUF995 domain-containing protein n=1 Tax=Sinorhizobium numidicum TaxID=680248 RepID=A0ABY8CQN7_9HYPH|nr:DUF995 domain-containing protein [Sinorhizobium numidicum]WEX74977.1 DUF995 domain-containing protein [Sinorhizobium numidicum]WEX80971.1 DUF995 domain-containing protein [Sinorhizobium numidicum]